MPLHNASVLMYEVFVLPSIEIVVPSWRSKLSSSETVYLHVVRLVDEAVEFPDQPCTVVHVTALAKKAQRLKMLQTNKVIALFMLLSFFWCDAYRSLRTAIAQRATHNTQSDDELKHHSVQK